MPTIFTKCSFFKVLNEVVEYHTHFTDTYEGIKQSFVGLVLGNVLELLDCLGSGSSLLGVSQINDVVIEELINELTDLVTTVRINEQVFEVFVGLTLNFMRVIVSNGRFESSIVLELCKFR